MSGSIKLNIPQPCRENWNQMTPQEQGRFCASCQKVVVDFSAMTDAAINDFFSRSTGNVCGHFAKDQLDKELSVPVYKRRLSWAYVWNMLLAGFLVTKANAQGKVVVNRTTAVHQVNLANASKTLIGDTIITEHSLLIRGHVLEEGARMPLPGASVMVRGTNRGTVADNAGYFELIVEGADTAVLVISAVGFETLALPASNLKGSDAANVLLTLIAAEMGDVVVTRVRKKRATVKRTINSIIPAALKKEIRVYPNPSVRGNEVAVRLVLSEKVNYKLELFNPNGLLVAVQPVILQTKEQTVILPTRSAWAAGIYWIRISAPGSTKVVAAKLVLQ